MTDTTIFEQKLATYKQLIDADIAAYAKKVAHSTKEVYGTQPALATDAYLSILTRGGKRIRGALVMLGYEMCAGTNQQMIIEAARAIEMIHAYMLIVDDIQDRSPTRRGGPAAHKVLSDHHVQQAFRHDPEHFGIALALDGALAGAHAAQMTFANLDAPENLRLNALSILNRGMLITAHGQTIDIVNEVSTHVTEADVNKVMEWKTAHYTFLNPLHIGMILAGGECHDTDAITAYAMHTGRAFQITDDILGTFGEEFESGKSPMDDVREGKRTLLVVYALEHASEAGREYLLDMLGSQKLSKAQFEKCKKILLVTGSLDYAKEQARADVQAALQALESVDQNWNQESIEFLAELASYILTRTS